MSEASVRQKKYSHAKAQGAQRYIMDENRIGKIIIDAAIAVHRNQGPGLLETVYEVALQHELQLRGLKAERQVPVPIEYQGVRLDEGFRADMVVNDLVILELKSVEQMNKVHTKQLLTYLRLSDKRLGYLLNFGEETMKQGIARVVNKLPE